MFNLQSVIVPPPPFVKKCSITHHSPIHHKNIGTQGIYELFWGDYYSLEFCMPSVSNLQKSGSSKMSDF